MEKVTGHRGDLTLGTENNMISVLSRLSNYQLWIRDAVVGVVNGWTTKESRFDS
jgi:hypothetical protein